MPLKKPALLLALTLLAPQAKADPPLPTQIQSALTTWLAARAAPEHVTGVAAYISFGDSGPAIEAYAGKTGAAPNDPVVDQSTLFQMGSTSKSFAAAVILKLEAAGKLSLDDKLAKWLPQYPAWKDVSIRQLLNMTSGLPNYSETEAMSRTWIANPKRDMTAAQLIAFAYSPKTPKPGPYAYSNTNYVLAGMIAAKAAGRPYRDLVRDLVIAATNLGDTFYEDGAYPPSVTARLAHGYFANPACTDDQPNCKESWNLPLMGQDVRPMSTSWAQAAGGAIANARDVDRWMRAVFKGRVVPSKQQAEWTALISTKTGQPLSDVTPDDPRGFALGISKAILADLGPHWFYQGETLGFRTLYVWFPESDLMLTLQTNSQPASEEDKLHDLIPTLYAIVKPPT